MAYSKQTYGKSVSKRQAVPEQKPRISRKDWAALVLGTLLVFFGILFWPANASTKETVALAMASSTPISGPNWLPIASAILGFFLVTTFLVRKWLPNSKTWYVFSMVETVRFNPVFDRLKNAKWLEIAAEIGAVIGYGAVAVDYFWGRKLKNKLQRFALFGISVIVLGLLSGLLFGNLSGNPLIKGPSWLYQLFFGIFGLAGFLLLALFTQGIDGVLKILAGKNACPGIAPIIPGVQTPNVPLFVPIEAWVSLVAILIIHESSHGFLVRRHNLKLESSGLLLAGILPIGAFVKPDEKAMLKIEKRKQVQIMSAGPSSNLYSFFLVGLLFAGLTAFVFNPTIGELSSEVQRSGSLGVKISAVDQNISLCGETIPSPAYGELETGSNILSINDQNVHSLNEAIAFLRSNPSEPKKFVTDSNGIIATTTLTANALGRFGIQLENIPNPAYSIPPNTELLLNGFQLVFSIIAWFITLSLLVAIANFLPVDPLDGGRIAKFMIAPYFGFLQMNEEDTERFVGRLFLWILIPLIILNAIPIFL